jgi:predicted component of type VI protein secretion system
MSEEDQITDAFGARRETKFASLSDANDTAFLALEMPRFGKRRVYRSRHLSRIRGAEFRAGDIQ